MKTWALISPLHSTPYGHRVWDLVESEEKPGGDPTLWIEVTGIAGVQTQTWILDNGTGQVRALTSLETAAEIAANRPAMTKLEFFNLFKPEEKALIANSDYNGELTDEVKASLRTYRFALQLAEEVHLSNATTIGGVQYLVLIGILTPTRAAQILAGQVPA